MSGLLLTHSLLSAMGNKVTGKNEKKEKEFKWNVQNTKTVTVLNPFSKVYGCDCRRSLKNENEIIVIAAAQDAKIRIGKIEIKVDKKGKVQKINCNRLGIVTLTSAWVLTTAISPNIKRCASGDLNNNVSVYNLNEDTLDQNIDHPTQQLPHSGYISTVKFLDNCQDDRYLVSSSGDGVVILWDIDQKQPVKTYDVKKYGDALDVDYIFMQGRHIIVYCTERDIFIDDMTEEINVYEKKLDDNGNDDDENKEENQDFIIDEMKDSINCIVPSQIFEPKDQESDNIHCKFSPNGDFLCVLTLDGTYTFYYKEENKNRWTNTQIIQWRLLCQKSVRQMIQEKNYNDKNDDKADVSFVEAVSLIWADNNTIMIGCGGGNCIYCTEVIPLKSNEIVINAVKYGVRKAIENLPSMNWVGLTDDVTFSILMYFNDIDVYDYIVIQQRQSARTACLSACKWGKDYNRDAVISGYWIGGFNVDAIVPKHFT